MLFLRQPKLGLRPGPEVPQTYFMSPTKVVNMTLTSSVTLISYLRILSLLISFFFVVRQNKIYNKKFYLLLENVK